MPKFARWALAPAALGALHALSFCNGSVPSLLIPLIQWLSFSFFTVLIFQAESCRSVLLKSTIFGTVSFSLSLYWLYISMHNYGNLPSVVAVFVVVLFSFYLSWFLSGAAVLFHYLKTRAINDYSKRAHFVLPLLWAALVTLGELGRGYFFTGFPWNNIAYAYVDSPFHTWAPLGGAYMVTFVAAFCAGMTTLFILSTDKTREFALFSAFIALFGISLLLQNIDWSRPVGKPLRARLIQGNIDQHDKFDPLSAMNAVAQQMEMANTPLKAGELPPQLIIFPETIMPSFQNRMPPSVWRGMIHLARNYNAHLYVGTPLYSRVASNPPQMTNALIEIRPDTLLSDIYEGNGIEYYSKRHLVPFGEFIPTGFHWFVRAMNIPLGDFNRGMDNQSNFVVGDQVLAPNICYEDIFGEELVDALFTKTDNNPGASIMLNVSNLAWFGDSSALRQQLQQARMRAIETGRPMVRTTNTGVTGVIDHHGVITAQLPVGQAGILDTTVQGTEGYTLYSRTGNIPIVMLCLVIVIQFWLLTCNPFFKLPSLPEQRSRTEYQ